MKKKKVLFIIWSYTYGGGAERILTNLVNNMDPNKYEIDILEYWHSDIKKEDYKDYVNVLPPVVDSTKASKIRMYITKLLLENYPEILRKKFIPQEYDYEIAFNSLIPTYLIAKNGKTISWNHGDLYSLKDKKNKHQRHLQQKSYAHIKKIVAISQNTYNSILEIYPEYKDKLSLIYNGFDFNLIRKQAAEKIALKPDKFTFLSIGRLDNNKNPLYLIEIANSLKKAGKEFNLWFIGKGDLKNAIEAKIQEYHLEDEVKLLSYQNNPYPYIKAANVVTLSSHSEGFPTVIVEGLSLSKPFISTNVGGALELSNKNKCGFVANNQEEFLNYAQELIDNSTLYNKMSQNCVDFVEQFKIENQVNKLYNLFNELDKE